MKFILVALVCLILGGVAGGCATAGKSLPKQIPDALNAACDVYSKAKPEVIKARDFAKAHWNDKVPGSDKDLIPPDVKQILQQLDTYLPELDKAGLALCAASEGLNAFSAAPGSKVDWNEVLTVVLKGASIALDMKAKGVI